MPVFTTPEPISVTIELSTGDVRIIASDRTDTVIEVRPRDDSKASDIKSRRADPGRVLQRQTAGQEQAA